LVATVNLKVDARVLRNQDFPSAKIMPRATFKFHGTSRTSCGPERTAAGNGELIDGHHDDSAPHLNRRECGAFFSGISSSGDTSLSRLSRVVWPEHRRGNQDYAMTQRT
jgi:hypothetical protein